MLVKLVFEDVRRMHWVDWLIFTDLNLPEYRPKNVHFIPLSQSQFEAIVSDRMGKPYEFSYGYKLCDMKPAYGDFFS